MSSLVIEPVEGFSEFKLSPSIQRGISAAGWSAPRPIQTRTIPAALEGRDIMGLAQTGTGKTAAFALPIIERFDGGRRGAPKALIVAPTRELASQIDNEIRFLARYTGIRTATVFGGVSAEGQIKALRREPEVVVACPGRLLDLWRQGILRLDKVEVLVLDEADHMFDMGFMPDIRRILAALPEQRQNMLFSATMPAEIRGFADSLLRHPHVVELNHSTPVGSVSHFMYATDQQGKLSLLKQVLSDDSFVSAIVFTRTKHRAKKIAVQLDRSGHRAVALQGNMSQSQRTRAMNGFRKEEFKILVATDIAARGIDVQHVSHVVNFDMPDTADGYTHRIGRTGRADRVGKAINFITSEDVHLARKIETRIDSPVTKDSSLEASFKADRSAPPRRTRNSGSWAPKNRRRFL